MQKNCLWLSGLLIFALAFPVVKVLGQAVYGSVVGTVTDVSGSAVPNAKVTITNVDQGVSFSTTTNAVGNYEQTHLIVGKYRVRIEAQGFQASVQENLQVNVDAVAQVNATLQVGSITETVNVTAEVPLLKTQRADVALSLSPKAVVELPVFQRDINRYFFLTPGVQLNNVTAASEQPQDIFRIRVNGQYWGGVSFQLDGTDNRESVLGEPVVSPNLDAVNELKITTADYDAEFGQANQAVIAAQTKSGTNELHGSAFWFRRDNNTSARDPFTQSQPIIGSQNRFIPPTLWNQFGGSVGGPIRKDKTFIFGDYQGSRQSNGGSVRVRVPTAAERAGDLSGLGTAIFDPCNVGLSNCNLPPSQRAQFAGNQIPTSRLSPQAQNLLKFIPLPNLLGGKPAEPNYVASGVGVVNSDAFDVRVDHYQTEKLHMFGRYSLQQYSLGAPGAFGLLAGGPNLSGVAFAGTSDLRNQSLASGFDYTVRTNWLTDFRFGFFRYRVFVNPNGLGTTPATDAGIPGLNLDAVTSGMPAFFINGVGGFTFGYALPINQCNCPLNEQENQFQWVNNWTILHGNHTTKLGADIRYHQNLRVPSDSHRSGQLNFESDRTLGPTGGGLGMASFLLGDVSSIARYVSSSTDAAERQNRWFYYGQDTWRITSKLTVNYGLRWEIYFPQYVNGAGKGGFVNFATGEVLVAGKDGVGLNGNVSNSLSRFAPRAAIAYQATPKTVIRMGYGRSFDVGVFGTSFGHNVTQNLPVLAIQQLTPANNFLSVFSLAQGPPSIDPNTILDSQPNGPTGRRMLPNGVTPNILPLTTDGKMRLPTVDSWNLTVERQLTPTIAGSVAYVANKGTHTFPSGGQYNANQPTVVGFGTLSSDQRKPFFQKYGWTQPLKYYSDDASNNFSSLQTRIEKRFSNGLLFQANYTWAHAFDYSNSYFNIDARIDHGPEDILRNHVFVLSEVYELPFGKGKKLLGGVSRKVDYLVGGWQFDSVWTWESGMPFTPSYKNCGSDRDTGPCRATKVGDAGVPSPGRQGWFGTTGGVELAANGQTIGPWQRPQKGTFGFVGRNSFRGPRFFDADVSFLKNFQVTERLRWQFRAESFNFFNHVNLGQPDGCVDCPNGGKIFALAPLAAMRQWQFGLRLEF